MNLDAPTRRAVSRLTRSLRASLSDDPPQTHLGRLLSQGLIIGSEGIKLERDAGLSWWDRGAHIHGPACCSECGGDFDDPQTDERTGRISLVYSTLRLDMRDPDDPEQREIETRDLCCSCANEWALELVLLGEECERELRDYIASVWTEGKGNA